MPTVPTVSTGPPPTSAHEQGCLPSALTCHRMATVCRDPLANSYVSSIAEDPAADPRLSVEDVPRTAEEDEEFGIAHLRAHGTEGVTPEQPGELTCRPGSRT